MKYTIKLLQLVVQHLAIITIKQFKKQRCFKHWKTIQTLAITIW